MDTTATKKPRGFAGFSPERRREIARMGGKAVPAQSRSFARDSDLAARAGAKGGRSISPEKRSFSQDRQLASEAGTKGGLVSSSKHPVGSSESSKA